MAEGEGPERLYALFYDYVPDILERRGAHRDGHLALAQRWRDQGRLLMAGALGDPPDGALFVLRVDGPEEAEEFTSADPYIAAELVTGWRVVPWTVVVRA